MTTISPISVIERVSAFVRFFRLALFRLKKDMTSPISTMMRKTVVAKFEYYSTQLRNHSIAWKSDSSTSTQRVIKFEH